ncbi:uncharacterized protein [Amphiura filiformis]|uniref:uncharacterized protein n=1 Tax=Amphiura filiformis TaxID=82378 RepID=UPI003B21D6E5
MTSLLRCIGCVEPDMISSESTEPYADAVQLRSKVASTLRSSKPPKSNVSNDERKAINVPKKEDSIVILPADKGKATVVLDKQEYNEKVDKMLSDTKTYEQLSADPTPKYKRKLVSILSRLSDEEKITKAKYKQLYPTAENVPRLYCTPKIHKPNAPLRPIVDYTSTIGYETSKWLADILAPMVGNSEHHVVNSRQLAEEMVDVVIEEGDILNSHDVVSLFTCTPVNKRFGAAMGSPVSPLAANIFMEHLEGTAIATAPMECKPKLWKKYVDDILEIVAKDEVNALTDHLNQVDDTDSIKFTYEEEKDGKIPFLDALIVRRDDGSIKLLVYRKATHTDQYLNFRSHHPLHHKLGVVRTLMDRKNRIVTEDEDKEREDDHIKGALQKCGYPDWSIKKVKDQMAKPKSKKERKKKDDSNKSKRVGSCSLCGRCVRAHF